MIFLRRRIRTAVIFQTSTGQHVLEAEGGFIPPASSDAFIWNNGMDARTR